MNSATELFEKAQRRADQLQAVNRVAQCITNILDLEALLPEIARSVRTELNVYNVAIGLIEGDELVFKAGDGGYPDGEFLPGARLKIAKDGITGWVARTGSPLLVPDVRVDSRYLSYAKLPDTQSELAVPLKTQGEIIGVLDIESD